MARSAFVFDLDGTIWDSYAWYSAVLDPCDRVAQQRTISQLRQGASIITLASARGISKGTLRNRCSQCVELPPLYPHVLDTISSLNKQQCRLGVVTSLSGELAGVMLDRVGLTCFFGTIIHPGNCPARKPSAGPLLQALSELGDIPGASAVYVGDTETDRRCAVRAGVPFVWAAYGYGGRPSGDYQEIRDIAEVLNL
jgi:phosphoglycolate phosphatase